MTGGAAEDYAASLDKGRKRKAVPAAIGPGGRADRGACPGGHDDGAKERPTRNEPKNNAFAASLQCRRQAFGHRASGRTWRWNEVTSRTPHHEAGWFCTGWMIFGRWS